MLSLLVVCSQSLHARPVPAQGATATTAPSVAWIEGESALLIRWQQSQRANRVFVYSCTTPDVLTCQIVAELHGNIRGKRSAIAWGQPGQYIVIGETYLDNGVYNWVGVSDATEIPPFKTRLPLVISD